IVTDEYGLTNTTPQTPFLVNTLNHAPKLSTISLPAIKAKVIILETDLVVENGTDEDSDSLTYYFEIDKVNTFNSQDKIASGLIVESDTTTSFHVSGLEEDRWYYWRVKASDSAAESPWIYGSFFVNCVNEIPLKPIIKNPEMKTWSEILRPEISVHPAKDSDGYAATGKITYYFELFSDPDCENLVQDWESTYPKFMPGYDLENNTIYYYKVMAMDEYNTSSGYTDLIQFFVKRKNHDPEISGTPEITINEDQPYSFLPEAHDIDPDDSLIFSITNKPLWAGFDTITGQLSGTPSNDDVGTSENIIITVTDAYGGQDSLNSFTLTVINVNDAPQITGTPLTSINENSFYTFVPSASDVDKNDILTFSIENKPVWADFNTTTGELNGTPVNNDVGITENIIISVTDESSAIASLPSFSLKVIDTNTPPVANDDIYYPSEDAPFTLPAPGILGNDTDADNNDILTAQLVNDVAHGSLSLNNDGSFTYTPQNNYTGDDYFIYTVSDGLADSNEATVTLTVSGQNDPPIISFIPDQIMVENTAICDLNFTIQDDDSSLNTIVVSAQSNDQSLIPDANIIIHDLGVENLESKQKVTLLPLKDKFGKALITITVQDDAGSTASRVFELDVRSKSHPPIKRYYLLNPESLNFPINIVSLGLINQITFGSTTFDLNLFGSKIISPAEMVQAGFVQGNAISGTSFYTLGQSGPGTNMLVPESFSGRSFVIPHIRYSHKYFILSPYGDTSVHIKNNNTDTNIPIAKGEVIEFDAGDINPDMSTINSSLPILISHMGFFNTIPYDIYPVPPVSTEIFGLHLNKTIIGAIEDNTNVTIYVDNVTTTTFTLNANEYHEIAINGILDALGNAVHIVADKPVAAVQADDPNGSTASAYFDKSYFAYRCGIPVNAENVIVITDDPDLLISIFSKSKWPLIKSFNGADNNTPGRFILTRDSIPFWKANLNVGNHIISSKPIYLIYDTQIDEERHNVLGKLQPK
ncbi:MAG: cadherin-like domain-containing protein, partial [Desulfobacteraceae bacterium]|nr:cadherin-like domain-containing protein [Desulfobacteraceae bacterium]